MTVFCLVELDGDGVADASLRALTLARSVAGQHPATAGGLAVVVFGPPPGDGQLRELAAYGATDVYVCAGIDGYAPQAWARVLAGLISDDGAVVPGDSAVSSAAVSSAAAPGAALLGAAVLAAGTEHGNEVLAHLAAIAGLPMAANCVAASPGDGGSLRLVRQRWAGLLLEEAVLTAPVALLTAATDAVAAEPAPEPAAPAAAGVGVRAVVDLARPPTAADLVVRAAETALASAAGRGGASLATARVVVGGGRGVGSADGFAALEELAELLGGVVGVSRVVTSEGWRPHAMQVGQTGTRITPDLYLACGISGAIQHFAGCAGAKHIIAVNTDPAAPMMTRADYAVVGDLHQVVPALVKALRGRGQR